jgi:predicted MFS family arabinose efflux permease
MQTRATASIFSIIAILYCLGFTNLFLRASLGVMAPDLAREFAMEPAVLSAVASAFFFSYALMQLPTGIFFDRYGARLTLSTMLAFTAVGTALFALSQSSTTLIAGRTLMGLGLTGTFTGAFVVMARWLPADRVVSQIGALNSFATLGTIFATTPFALLIGFIGWRTSYWFFAAGVVLLGIAIAVVLHDAPDGAQPSEAKRETMREALGGVVDVLRQPHMGRLLFAGIPLAASGTISGVWGAPYLRDVHGLGNLERGSILLVMAVCGLAGHFAYGQIARRLNTIRGVVLGCAAGSLAATVLLASLSHPPVPLVIALFCLLGFACAYPTITYAHARGLVPAHLLGRGVATSNMGVMTAIAGVQMLFGWVLGHWAVGDGSVAEAGYRMAFAMQSLLSLLALVIYFPIKDVKPSS